MQQRDAAAHRIFDTASVALFCCVRSRMQRSSSILNKVYLSQLAVKLFIVHRSCRRILIPHKAPDSLLHYTDH